MKRTQALVMACLLMFAGGLVFGAAASEDESSGEYGTPGVFPLKKTFTFSFGGGSIAFDPAENPMIQMVEEATNVHVEWVPIENDEKRNILFASDDYPDSSGSTGRWQALISSLLAEGVVRDLNPYLGQGYTPNFDAIIKEFPESYGYMLNPAGQLQAMPHFRMQESSFLEQHYVINRKWLDTLGLEKPTTTEELKQVLIAFRDGDPNGNGKKDEIPLTYSGRTSQFRDQNFYGIFGGPIKEPFVIKNGKVTFAGVHPAFKAYVKYFADLYSEGLIDLESATQTTQDLLAKVDNPAGNTIGWMPVHSGSFWNFEQYPNRTEFEPMSPPQSPGGPKPEMWLNPGVKAVKNMWFMTDKNPNPELIMAWIDRFYTLEMTLQCLYGPIGKGVELVNGRWQVIPHPEDPEWLAKNAWPKVEGPGIRTNDDFVNRLILDPVSQRSADVFYEYYVDYVAEEQWHRPELSAEETTESNQLRTDIWKLWLESQARWITGKGDIDAEWDDYVKQLENMNLARYIEIAQAAQDRFLGAQK
jgi:putative aldouronate transport system substrate-binding protein